MALVADGLGHAAVLTPEALTKSYRDIAVKTAVWIVDAPILRRVEGAHLRQF
jgi:hypothetical protein